MIRMTGNHWVGQERILSQSLQRKYGPANSLSSDFSLQNCKIISFYCFKPSRLWPLVSATAGKWIHLLIQVHGHLAMILQTIQWNFYPLVILIYAQILDLDFVLSTNYIPILLLPLEKIVEKWGNIWCLFQEVQINFLPLNPNTQAFSKINFLSCKAETCKIQKALEKYHECAISDNW